ncbi:hypothetical protein AB0B50_13200 [Streptomyces sp. NPDC041068]|uniref:hypothetical protein n=1 Tax=Streptomyces sp. NPDC041068 TaxID=3155130 RepID=UPI00340ACDF0
MDRPSNDVSRRTAVTLCCTAVLLTGCGVFGGEGRDGNGAKPHGKPPAGKAAKNASPNDVNGDGYDDYVTILGTRLDVRSNGRTTQTLSVAHGSEEGLRDWKK